MTETVRGAQAAERIAGKLIRIVSAKGYGFLSTGRAGEADYFLRRRDVRPQFWFLGQEFTFAAAPAHPGGSCPRAVAVEPVLSGQRPALGGQAAQEVAP